MSLIDKIMFKFQKLLRFEKLKPIDSIEFDESIENNTSNHNMQLFKKTVLKYPELKEVIWIGIYHCIMTFKLKKECLSVLNCDFQLILELFEGDDMSVVVPNSVKVEYHKGNVLATFHNHVEGTILPSINDFNNSILPKINFTIITSENILGIIVNDNDSLSTESFQLLMGDFKLFEVYLNFCFTKDEFTNIKKLENAFTGEEFKKQREKLFNRYIFKNTEKFVAEFNCRMEKYNVYYLYIKL